MYIISALFFSLGEKQTVMASNDQKTRKKSQTPSLLWFYLKSSYSL